MSEVWDTKYGKRRVRHEPATLDDAVFAAQGLTDDLEMQVEIAASLIDLPREEVRAVLIKRRPPIRLDAKRVTTTGANGQARAVVVERRPARRMVVGAPVRLTAR